MKAAYQTIDGRFFDNEQEAINHETGLNPNNTWKYRIKEEYSVDIELMKRCSNGDYVHTNIWVHSFAKNEAFPAWFDFKGLADHVHNAVTEYTAKHFPEIA